MNDEIYQILENYLFPSDYEQKSISADLSLFVEVCSGLGEEYSKQILGELHINSFDYKSDSFKQLRKHLINYLSKPTRFFKSSKIKEEASVYIIFFSDFLSKTKLHPKDLNDDSKESFLKFEILNYLKSIGIQGYEPSKLFLNKILNRVKGASKISEYYEIASDHVFSKVLLAIVSNDLFVDKDKRLKFLNNKVALSEYINNMFNFNLVKSVSDPNVLFFAIQISALLNQVESIRANFRVRNIPGIKLLDNKPIGNFQPLIVPIYTGEFSGPYDFFSNLIAEFDYFGFNIKTEEQNHKNKEKSLRNQAFNNILSVLKSKTFEKLFDNDRKLLEIDPYSSNEQKQVLLDNLMNAIQNVGNKFDDSGVIFFKSYKYFKRLFEREHARLERAFNIIATKGSAIDELFDKIKTMHGWDFFPMVSVETNEAYFFRPSLEKINQIIDIINESTLKTSRPIALNDFSIISNKIKKLANKDFNSMDEIELMDIEDELAKILMLLCTEVKLLISKETAS